MKSVEFRYKVGDRVRVKTDVPGGNPRTPVYVRGKRGTIGELHGVIYNPQDHRETYPPLYTVVFDIKEVFGTATQDTLWVDVHEEWMERAPG